MPRWTPIPTAKPVPGATLDRAWVWDRNVDGRVDYVAYLLNAQAVPATALFAHASALLAAIHALTDRCGPVNGAIRRP